MTKTLALNEKLILPVTSTLNMDTLRADMLAGHIQHDPLTAAGQIIIAALDLDEKGKITLASVKRGDMDGDGVITSDDFTVRRALRVVQAADFLVLDVNGYISNALAP